MCQLNMEMHYLMSVSVYLGTVLQLIKFTFFSDPICSDPDYLTINVFTVVYETVTGKQSGTR